MKQSIQHIKQRVMHILHTKMRIDKQCITPQADLMRHLGLDSLDAVELIVELEQEFDIAISDQEADELTTVGDVIAAIEAKMLLK